MEEEGLFSLLKLSATMATLESRIVTPVTLKLGERKSMNRPAHYKSSSKGWKASGEDGLPITLPKKKVQRIDLRVVVTC